MIYPDLYILILSALCLWGLRMSDFPLWVIQSCRLTSAVTLISSVNLHVMLSVHSDNWKLVILICTQQLVDVLIKYIESIQIHTVCVCVCTKVTHKVTGSANVCEKSVLYSILRLKPCFRCVIWLSLLRSTHFWYLILLSLLFSAADKTPLFSGTLTHQHRNSGGKWGMVFLICGFLSQNFVGEKTEHSETAKKSGEFGKSYIRA